MSLHGWGGRVINGAMAEYVLFPNVTYPSVMDDKLIKLPDNISYRDGALIEPLRLGIGMASKAKTGDVVVVLGQEIMGLGAVVHLKKIGAAKVIASDISKKRLQASREVGADVVVDVLKKTSLRWLWRRRRAKAPILYRGILQAGKPSTGHNVVRPFGGIC